MQLSGSKLFLSKQDVEAAVEFWLTKYGEYGKVVADGSHPLSVHPSQPAEIKHTRGGCVVTFYENTEARNTKPEGE